MQLAAFNHNNFPLGHAAMAVNEGLPLYVVHRLEQRFDLSSMTVGILGMAFKAGSDDTRSSLSYKLKRILAFKADKVVCTDPYVTVDSGLLPLEEVLTRSDLLVVGGAASGVPGAGHGQARRGYLGRARRGRAGMTGHPRVSVVVSACNEGDQVISVLDRLFESVRLPCEVLLVVDSADDTTVPVAEEYALKEPRRHGRDELVQGLLDGLRPAGGD